MIEPREYIDVFKRDVAAIAGVAERNTHALLPCCPGWNVGQLLGHLGVIYISISKNISSGYGEDITQELEDLELEPAYEQWFRAERSSEAMPADVARWFLDAGTRLESTFRSSNPTDRTWTWFPNDQTVGFWMRRMAHETAVHRWDVQQAVGATSPIVPPDVAADGVDEALQIYQPFQCRPESDMPGQGESYHFHCTDTAGEWIVRFQDAGMDVERKHAKADVAIRGTASDLLLFLWHRIPAGSLDIVGDRSLADRYFALVPPD